MKEFIVQVIDPEEIQWYEEEPEIPELVRCEDCIFHSNPRYKYRENDIFCDKYELLHDARFYCADGVR